MTLEMIYQEKYEQGEAVGFKKGEATGFKKGEAQKAQKNCTCPACKWKTFIC